MKKLLRQILRIFTIAVLFVPAVYAKDIDVDEIKTDQQVDFENYQGRHSKNDSYRSIRVIGRKLATGAEDADRTVRYFLKYSVIHAIDDTTGDLFDADIFVIEKNGQVDHIRNVRLILSSFLEKRFKYSRKDAALLAKFLTVYNAVYRGNMEYISGRYKPLVLEYVSEDNLGISTKYYEWPGKTRILIPLTDRAARGDLSSLDTTELTDENVINNLREEDDKGIKDRREMTDLKEREIEQQEKELEKEKQELKKEKEKLEKEEEKLDRIKDPEEREKKEEELTDRRELLERREDDIDDKENAIEEKEKEVERDRKEISIDEKPDRERDDLIKKENELEKKEEELKNIEDRLKSEDTDDKIFGDKLYYLKINDFMSSGHYNNTMHLINPDTRKVIGTSPLKKICGNRYDVFSSGVVVIAYKGNHSSDHFLALLDLETLAVKEKGSDNILYRSFIEIKDGSIYAIVKEGKKHYLARFNDRLAKEAQSDVEVSENTFISFYKNQIFINGTGRSIIALNKNNLTMIDTIR
jgi:hypothetical protein